MRLWAALILCVTVFLTHAETQDAKRLRQTIFQHYDKLVRPVRDQKTTTSVNAGLSPLFINDLDEEKQIFEIDAWIFMTWKDEYLTWNPEDYGGMTTLIVPSEEVWRPDLTIYNASPAGNLVIESMTNAVINYTGDVMWGPPKTVRTRCPQNNTGQQTDTVTCVVRIGSWTHHEYWVDLQDFSEYIKALGNYFQDTNLKWELASLTSERLSKYYACCKEPYPALDYKFTLKRKTKTSPECTQSGFATMPTSSCWECAC